jgi:hypothetical protein
MIWWAVTMVLLLTTSLAHAGAVTLSGATGSGIEMSGDDYLPLKDWTTTAGFTAVWRLEETGATTRDNAEGDSNNDLDPTNSPTQDGTNYVEGAYSNDFVMADNEYASCNTSTTCTELDVDTTGGDIDFSVICWARKDTDTNNTTYNTVIGNYNSSQGFELDYHTTNDTYEFYVADGDDQGAYYPTSGGISDDTWYHIVGRFDDGTDTIDMIVNGSTSLVQSATQQDCGNSSGLFTISNNMSTSDFDGNIDECIFIYEKISLSQACRLCACGSNGENCMCDPTDPDEYLPCTVDADCQKGGNTTAQCGTDNVCSGYRTSSDPGCSSCTLPNCYSTWAEAA